MFLQACVKDSIHTGLSDPACTIDQMTGGVSVQGGLCLGGLWGVSVWVEVSVRVGVSVQEGVSVCGVSVRGVSVQGGLCAGGSLSRGISVR